MQADELKSTAQLRRGVHDTVPLVMLLAELWVGDIDGGETSTRNLIVSVFLD